MSLARAGDRIHHGLGPTGASRRPAVKDTTRELGGALGVAVVGSIASSLFSIEQSLTVAVR